MDFSLLECLLGNAFIYLDRFRCSLLKMLPEMKVFQISPCSTHSHGCTPREHMETMARSGQSQRNMSAMSMGK